MYSGAAISTDIATFFLMVCIIIYIYFTKIYEETWPGLKNSISVTLSIFTKNFIFLVSFFSIYWVDSYAMNKKII